MMSDFTALPQRAASLSASRAAMHVAKPYMARFEAWNSRAAKIGAALLSKAVSDEEKADYWAQIDELSAEVSDTWGEFRSASEGCASHSRLDDVDAAFRRLVTMLGPPRA